MNEWEMFLENLEHILADRPDAPRFIHTTNKGIIRRVRFSDLVYHSDESTPMTDKQTLAIMTTREKNELIHTRLMRQRLDVVCSGPTGTHPDTPYEWRCRACGRVGALDSATVHMMAPPDYFGSLDAALHLFDNTGPMVGTRTKLWRGIEYHAVIEDYPGTYQNTIENSRVGFADALCRATLLAAGVVDKEGVVLDEVERITQ